MATSKKVTLHRGTTARIPIRLLYTSEPRTEHLSHYISQLTIKEVKQDWDYDDARALIRTQIDLDTENVLFKIGSLEYVWFFQLTAEQTYLPVGDYYADIELLTKPGEEEEENSLTNCRLGTFIIEVVGGPNNRAVEPSLHGTDDLSNISNQIRIIYDDSQVKQVTILDANTEIDIIRTPPKDGRRYLYMWDGDDFKWDPEYFQFTEDLTSQIDGERFVFTYTMPLEEKYGPTKIYYDGKTYFPGIDYEIDYAAKTITFPIPDNITKQALGSFSSVQYSWQDMWDRNYFNIPSDIKIKIDKTKFYSGTTNTDYTTKTTFFLVPMENIAYTPQRVTDLGTWRTYWGVVVSYLVGETSSSSGSEMTIGAIEAADEFIDNVFDMGTANQYYNITNDYGFITYRAARPMTQVFNPPLDGVYLPRKFALKGTPYRGLVPFINDNEDQFDFRRDIHLEYPVKHLILGGNLPLTV